MMRFSLAVQGIDDWSFPSVQYICMLNHHNMYNLLNATTTNPSALLSGTSQKGQVRLLQTPELLLVRGACCARAS
jgi:hypothetical protein